VWVIIVIISFVYRSIIHSIGLSYGIVYAFNFSKQKNYLIGLILYFIYFCWIFRFTQSFSDSDEDCTERDQFDEIDNTCNITISGESCTSVLVTTK